MPRRQAQHETQPIKLADFISYPIGTYKNPFLKSWLPYSMRFQYESGLTHDFVLACLPRLGNPFLNMHLYEHFVLIPGTHPSYVRASTKTLSCYKNPTLIGYILPEIQYDTRDISSLTTPHTSNTTRFVPFSMPPIAEETSSAESITTEATVDSESRHLEASPPFNGEAEPQQLSQSADQRTTSPAEPALQEIIPPPELDQLPEGQTPKAASAPEITQMNTDEILEAHKATTASTSWADRLRSNLPQATAIASQTKDSTTTKPMSTIPQSPITSAAAATTSTPAVSWANMAGRNASTKDSINPKPPSKALPRPKINTTIKPTVLTAPTPDNAAPAVSQANEARKATTASSSWADRLRSNLPQATPQPMSTIPQSPITNATAATAPTAPAPSASLLLDTRILEIPKPGQPVIELEIDTTKATTTPSSETDSELPTPPPTIKPESRKTKKNRKKNTPIKGTSIDLSNLDQILAEQASSNTTYEKAAEMIGRQDQSILSFLQRNVKTLTTENITNLRNKCTGLPDEYRARIVAILAKENESRVQNNTVAVKKSKKRLFNMNNDEIGRVMAKGEDTWSLLQSHCHLDDDWIMAYIAAIAEKRLDLIDNISEKLLGNVPKVNIDGIHVLSLSAITTNDAEYLKRVFAKLSPTDEICYQGTYQSNEQGCQKLHSFVTDYLYLTQKVDENLLSFLCEKAADLKVRCLYPKQPNLYCSQTMHQGPDGTISILTKELKLSPMEIAVMRGIGLAIKVLHKKGMSITDTPHGPNLACMAVSNNQLPSLIALCKCGADLTATIGENFTLLDLALSNATRPDETRNFLPIIEYLICNTTVTTKISSHEVLVAARNLKQINEREDDIGTRISLVIQEAIRRNTNPHVNIIFRAPEAMFQRLVSNSRELESDSKQR